MSNKLPIADFPQQEQYLKKAHVRITKTPPPAMPTEEFLVYIAAGTASMTGWAGVLIFPSARSQAISSEIVSLYERVVYLSSSLALDESKSLFLARLYTEKVVGLICDYDTAFARLKINCFQILSQITVTIQKKYCSVIKHTVQSAQQR